MTDVEHHLATANAALTDLYRAIGELPADDFKGLGNLLLSLEDLKINLAATRDYTESRFVEAMGDLPELDLPEATLEVRRADSRKAWAHREVAAKVAEQLVASSVDFETGERLKTTEELITEVLNYAGVSYWKIKALDTLGISADDYCEVTEGPMKVRIKRV